MFFMIPSEQDLAEGFRASIHQISLLAAEAGSHEAAIAVHTKHNIPGSAIERVLGPGDTKRLLRGSVTLPGLRLHLITERIQSQFHRGPLLAAYVSPWFLAVLMKDDRVTDLVYLPWTRKNEASFFHQFTPQILMPPAGWNPPLQENSGEEDVGKENLSAPSGIRESLSPEERVLPLEHTIDPGFVNHRRIETIIGQEGRNAIDRAIAQLPPLPEGLRAVRVGRLYSDIMLSFCRATEAPPLGRILAKFKSATPRDTGQLPQIFCSTEKVGPCRDLYNVKRAVNRLHLSSLKSVSVELHYSTAHIFSDIHALTFKEALSSRSLLSFTLRKLVSSYSVHW